VIALVALALAADDEAGLSVHGDVKSFFTATFPYDHLLMPDAPSAQGVLDGRLKLEFRHRDLLRVTVHQTATALTAGSSSPLGTSTGVGLQAPEVVDLSWTAFSDDLELRGRIDRASVAWTPDGFALTVGRQPISFGNTSIFTPLDLVNPFTPAVIDQEYKPGVDAVRADIYQGTANRVTLAAAYAGSWDPDGLVLAAYGQTTVGVTDLGLFLGSVRGDAVIGVGVVTAIGPVGFTSDTALTLPAGGGDPFVRSALGTLFRPTSKTTVSAEFYVQTLGASNAEDYLSTTADPHFQRGEIWLMGVAYAALAVSQEITPTVSGSVAAIGNLLDPSAFLAPSIAWSVSNNVSLAAGGFVGLGARPDPVELTDLLGPDGLPLPTDQLDYLNSEFGTYPGVAFVQVRVYF
jgi:hypothetical protein